jgi:DNA-binding NarL/FixJ family response regulator
MLQRAREAIVALGDDRPLVLLVDDAHLLDDASATLLHQLVASRSTFVIATVRSSEPAPDPVMALWKDELAERIEVPPLGPDFVEALLTRAMGGPFSAATLHRLTEQSAGNALYLRELVLAALESGALRADDGVWRLTGSLVVSNRLVELIEARLSDVGEAEGTVLDALALAQPVAVSFLLGMIDLPGLGALEERGLIVTGYSGRRFEARLGHPLYAEVIRARVTPSRSLAVAGELARRIEARGARRREDPLRVATWRLDSGGTVSAGLTMRAALTARNAWDLDLAGRLVDAAVEAGAGFDAALLRAEVASLQGLALDAERQFAALGPDADDDARRVRLAAARVDNLVNGLCRCGEAIRVTEEAQPLISDPALRDALGVKLGYALHLQGRVRDALRVLEPLLDRAEGHTLVSACHTGGACLARAGRVTAAMEASERGRLAGVALAEPPRTFRPSTHQLVRCSALLAAGRVNEAQEIADGEFQVALASGAVNGQAVFSLMLARIDLLRGTVVAAAHHAREALDILRERRWVALVRLALIRTAMASAMTGAEEEARATLARLDAMGLPTGDLPGPELLRARAWTEVAAGDVGAAWAALETSAELAARGGDRVGEAKALHDLARLGRPGQVERRLTELSRLMQGELAQARARHAAALAAHDVGGLGRSADAFEALGLWLYAAEASAVAAAEARAAGDARRTAAFELRAAALARRCEGAVSPALRDVESHALLSSREAEVATLAAGGMSNREIAARLSLSVRTVENQLQRVYGKLGVARRAELADALASV